MSDVRQFLESAVVSSARSSYNSSMYICGVACMKFLSFVSFFLLLSGNIFAMEKFPLSEIKQPSDLFGREILPECTFESKYGKLTMKSVVVPDFSNDEKGLNRLKEEFDNIKSFMSETDLEKKGEIAKKIFCNDVVFGCFWGRIKNCTKGFSDFSGLLWNAVRARLFEKGVSLRCDICSTFAYGGYLSQGNIEYNSLKVIQPFSCAVGLLICCLKSYLCPDFICDYPKYLKTICDNPPRQNYLSWACFAVLNNEYREDLIKYVTEKKPGLWICEECY